MSRTVRIAGALALAVGVSVASPVVANAAPPSGERCGVYRYDPGGYDFLIWKNCSTGEQLVHVDRVAFPDKYVCVQAGRKAHLGDYGKVGPLSARNGYLSGTRC